MKFYGRSEELRVLNEAKERSKANSQMIVVMGRRRIGKTRLILESLKKEDYLYFFVSKKEESLLCQDFLRQIKSVYGEEPLGKVDQFQTVFQFVCQIATWRQVNLVIDEFQDFTAVNTSIYGDMQRDWDLNKRAMQLNLVLCGSVMSMMNRIFLDAGEPLFGRASGILRLTPFSIDTMRTILVDNRPTATADDLLALYAITGGVAQYIELFVERNALTRVAMIETIVSPQSLFLEEGKNVLIQDLGKDYLVYFSILSLIASGFTSRPKLESVLQKPIGGYLQRLERVYGIIKRSTPVFSKENSTDIRFQLADNFLRFWFRFVFKYQEMIEARNYQAVRTIIERDYQTFAGLSLEALIREQLTLSGEYTKVGNYWERRNQNEIDVVAVNEIERTAIIGEVKWQRNRASIAKLELKAEQLVRRHLQKFSLQYVAFGMEDIL
ncbi:MAG: ATP-binding protein [Bacteroidota bacterium]